MLQIFFSSKTTGIHFNCKLTSTKYVLSSEKWRKALATSHLAGQPLLMEAECHLAFCQRAKPEEEHASDSFFLLYCDNKVRLKN